MRWHFGGDGAEAEFSVVSAPAATLAVGATSPFTLSFSTTASGPRTAQISIASSSGVSFNMVLIGRGISPAVDTDSDGMNDAAEFKLAALSFDWQVAQPELVQTYYSNAGTAGLFTATQVRDLNIGKPLIQRKPDGRFPLTFSLQRSTDLATFSVLPFTAADVSVNGAGKIEFTFSSADNAAFFRLKGE